MSEKKKKTIIIVGAIVAVLVIVYIVALLTGNVKQQEPSEPSNTPNATASQSASEDTITSLEFANDKNFDYLEIGDTTKSWVVVDTSKYETDDLEVIISDPEIADIQLTNKRVNYQWFEITAKKTGATNFYIQTKDGTIKTPNKFIKVDRTREELEKEAEKRKEEIEAIEEWKAIENYLDQLENE